MPAYTKNTDDNERGESDATKSSHAASSAVNTGLGKQKDEIKEEGRPISPDSEDLPVNSLLRMRSSIISQQTSNPCQKRHPNILIIPHQS